MLKSSLLEEMSEIRRLMAAGRCFIIVDGWLELVSIWRVSLLGFLYGEWVPSVRFRVTSRKLQIFWFVLIEMFSPCFLNSRVMSFLVRSDCGPLAFLRSTSLSSL